MNIPPLWYPVIQQIQTTEPPTPTTLDRLGNSFHVLQSSYIVTEHRADLPRIDQLGWSAVEALETHLRFRNFADDWDAPGMEAYDDL
jgi:hypothetical protein